MTRTTGYQPVLTQPFGGYYYPAAATVPAATAEEGRMPTFLGACAAIFLSSVCVFSAAGEQYSWIPQLLGVLLGVLWLGIGVMMLGQSVRWSKPIIFYALYFLWASTTFIVTINFDYWFVMWQTTAKVVLVTCVVSQCIKTRRDLLFCCLLIALSSFAVMIKGKQSIIQALEFTGGARDSAALARASGTLLGNANNLGYYGVIVMTCGIFCIIGYRNLILKAIGFFSIFSGAYLVAASGSRTAILGVFVGAIVFYFYHIRKLGAGSIGKKFFVIIFAVVSLSGTVYYITKLPFFFRMRDTIVSEEAREREPRYQYFFKSLGVVAQKPLFGLGIGGFALHRLGTNPQGIGHYTHSSVSETLAASGLPGFLLYYASSLAMYIQLRRIKKLPLTMKDRGAINIVLTFFWVYLAVSVVFPLMYHRLIWPLIGACCGYLWNLERQYAQQQDPELAYYAMTPALAR